MKKVIILCNKKLLVSGLVTSFITVFLAILCMLDIENIDASKKLHAQLFMLMVISLYLIAVAICLPKWLEAVIFTNAGIEHKRQMQTYDKFKYIYKAYYVHRGVLPWGLKIYYIVISQWKLNNFELEHINRVNNNNVLKIRYSSSNYYKLLSILPHYHKLKLQEVWKKDR